MDLIIFQSKREVFVEELAKFIGVHRYGSPYSRKCKKSRFLINTQPLEDGDPCFKMANENYRFIIAFENSICKDYVSEKVYNGLRHVRKRL